MNANHDSAMLPYAAFGAQNKEPISFSTYGSRFSAYAFTYTTVSMASKFCRPALAKSTT